MTLDLTGTVVRIADSYLINPEHNVGAVESVSEGQAWIVFPGGTGNGFPVEALDMIEHVDYPHNPGRLPDCPACELGLCTCNPETDAPCVSVHCEQEESE